MPTLQACTAIRLHRGSTLRLNASPRHQFDPHCVCNLQCVVPDADPRPIAQTHLHVGPSGPPITCQPCPHSSIRAPDRRHVPASTDRQSLAYRWEQRDGQPAFRQELLKAYESRCVISGCAIEALLEAAHIMPYRGAHTNIVTNGLLLRADLHKLFDLHLLCVDPDTRTVRLSEGLVSSEYAAFDGVQLRVPVAPFFAPLSDALRYHYERCGWLYAAADGAPQEEYSPEAKANST